MSLFQAAFTTWCNKHPEVSLRQLADLSGTPNPSLSLWRSGERDITLSALAKLLPVIEKLSSRSEARILAQARRDDETAPEYLEELRAIERGEAPPLTDAISDRAKRWDTKARTDAEFEQMWWTLDSYMHNPAALDSPPSNILAYDASSEAGSSLRVAEDPKPFAPREPGLKFAGKQPDVNQ